VPFRRSPADTARPGLRTWLSSAWTCVENPAIPPSLRCLDVNAFAADPAGAHGVVKGYSCTRSRRRRLPQDDLSDSGAPIVPRPSEELGGCGPLTKALATFDCRPESRGNVRPPGALIQELAVDSREV
jgi:hypothetical protein